MWCVGTLTAVPKKPHPQAVLKGDAAVPPAAAPPPAAPPASVLPTPARKRATKRPRPNALARWPVERVYGRSNMLKLTGPWKTNLVRPEVPAPLWVHDFLFFPGLVGYDSSNPRKIFQNHGICHDWACIEPMGAMGGWQWDFLNSSCPATATPTLDDQARSLTETRYEEDPVLQTSCSYPCGSEACYRHECWLYRYINTWSSWPFLKGTKNFQRGNGGSPTGTNFVQLGKIRVHRISKAINQVCKLHEVAPRPFQASGNRIPSAANGGKRCEEYSEVIVG